jgi:hypothetical protein
MALVKCRDCGAQVSTNAKSCPKCGSVPPKQTSGCAWIVLALIAPAMIYGIYASAVIKPAAQEDARTKEAARVVGLTPQQRASEDRQAKIYSAKGACRIFVKERLYDPGSAEFMGYGSNIETNADTSTVKIPVTYRAKNAFGALVPTTISCTVTQSGNNWMAFNISAQDAAP